jgi:CheY-like chemotaxis protein
LFSFAVQATIAKAEHFKEPIDQHLAAKVDESSTDFLSSVDLLVVDDDSTVRSTVRMMLEDTGVRITEASDGFEAVTMFKSKTFDCVIMDCNMPIMDGFESTRQIRSLQQARGGSQRIPIIGHTANAQANYALACTAAGMDCVVQKGCERRALIAHVVRLICTGSGGAAGAGGAAGGGAEAGGATSTPARISGRDNSVDTSTSIGTQLGTTATLGDDEHMLPPVDLARGISLMGSESIFLMVLQNFRDGLAENLRSIQDAYNAKDLQGLSNKAHAFKGSASYAACMAVEASANNLQCVASDAIKAGEKVPNSNVCMAYARLAEEAMRVSLFLSENCSGTSAVNRNSRR